MRQILLYLENKKVSIYTNGYHHIDFINKHGIKLTINLIPGEVLTKEASIVGEEALLYLSEHLFNKVFIGANGFDEQYVTTPILKEKNLKRCALNQGMESYILIDSSKKNKKSKHAVCKTSDYLIITS